MRKLSVLVLVMMCLLVFQSMTVGASVVEPYYTDTDSITARLGISSGTATCYGRVVPASPSSSVTVTVTLEKKVGTDWAKVAAWAGSGSGPSGASISRTHSVAAGEYYRLKVRGVVKDAGGKVLERPLKYSTTKRA